MERWLKNLSIKNKLILIVMATVILSLSVVGIFVMLGEKNLIKQAMQQEVLTLAQIVGDRSTAALSFDDKDTATETLEALKLSPRLELACIYDMQGRVFSSVSQLEASDCPQHDPTVFSVFKDNALLLTHPIYLNNDRIGTVYLQANLEQLNTRVSLIISLLVFISLLSLVLAYWLANRLQVFISRPILELAEFAKNISLTSSYEKRIDVESQDEIGSLKKSFNQMLNKIQQHLEQLRVADERWQYALEGPQDGVWDYDCRSGEVFCSTRLKEMLGYSENENPFLSFKQLQECTHKGDQPLARLHLYNHYSGKTSVYTDEHRVQCKNGSYIWILDRGKVIERNENGDPVRMIGTFQDISKRKLQEEQLRRSQKMDAIGKLSGGIAHDYNNMLGIVLGYAELLNASTTLGAKQKTYVQEIIRASRRSANLTRKLLGLSGQKSSTKSVLNINKQVLGLQNVLEKTLTAQVQLKLELDENLWTVSLDGNDLENAIINLCINAAHAMEHMPGIEKKLVIKTKSDVRPPDETRPEQWVMLSISDNGCGMDSVTKAQIFDPFYSTKGDLGTGLGLSQVYRFVQRSDGVIVVDSEIGMGTTMTLYFPRHIGEVEYQPEDGIIPLFPEPAAVGKKNILVVDDELEMLKLTCEILQQHSYTVWPASNSQEALAILESQPIDLLLTDVIMPEINGYQLSAMVIKDYPSVKIKMMSGFNDLNNVFLQEKHEGLNFEVIHKPFTSETLLQSVRDAFSPLHGIVH